MVAAPVETAVECLGVLTPGVSICGLTKGQFSLLDLLRAVLAQTGPADVVVSTWTTGIRDAENARLLLERGQIRSFQLLTDRSFATRQPAYCAAVREIFGDAAIRATNTHAKFALIGNDAWRVVIRSSMNLNKNPRFEQFDLDDDAVIYEFFRRHVAEMADLMPPGPTVPHSAVKAGFIAALGGGVAPGVDLSAPDEEGDGGDFDTMILLAASKIISA
jgi:hypothetical protein